MKTPKKVAEEWSESADGVWSRVCLSKPFASAPYICRAYRFANGANWMVYGGGSGHAETLQEAREAADTCAHEKHNWIFREALRCTPSR